MTPKASPPVSPLASSTPSARTLSAHSPWSPRSRSPQPRCSRPPEHQRARAPRFPPLRGSVSSLASKARSAVPPTFVAMRSQCPSPLAQTAVQLVCRRGRLLGQSGLNKESLDSRRGEKKNTDVGFIRHAVPQGDRSRVWPPTNKPGLGTGDIILDLETFLECDNFDVSST